MPSEQSAFEMADAEVRTVGSVCCRPKSAAHLAVLGETIEVKNKRTSVVVLAVVSPRSYAVTQG
jgi:hypothetical protein